MGNPLYDQYYGQPPMQPPMQQPVSNDFMSNLLNFGSMIRGNPQLMVQNLLQSGRLSQMKFQQYSQIADKIVGRR